MINSKYTYFYENTGDYCYKNSDTLINKLDITNENDLFNAERELVSLRTTEIILNPIKGNFDFSHLKKLHQYLFQDIYIWAGKIRKCNIAKQDLFCLVNHIDSYADEIFNKLKMENYFISYKFDKKIDKLVELFADINALHPFREGNGRSQREFIEQLARINGIDLVLSNVSQIDMIKASHDSINGNNKLLKKLFLKYSKTISYNEQIEYINEIIIDKEIKKQIINNFTD